MDTGTPLSRRTLGIAGAAAGIAVAAGQAGPAAAKKKKKLVRLPQTLVTCGTICIEQPVTQGRGYGGAYMLEVMDVSQVVWFSSDNVPSVQSEEILVPEAGGEAGWLVYQISGPVKAAGDAGASGSLTSWFGSFLVKAGEINGIIKLEAELIAGDPPPAGIMVELDRPCVVVSPYLPQ